VTPSAEPRAAGDRQHVLAGKAHSRMLVDITRQCIAGPAVEARDAP